MKKVLKALRWFGIEYLKTFAFFTIIGVVLGGLMTFIAYPVQTITFVVVAIVVIGAFLFVYES